MKPILVFHGPNLNMLGVREPSIYGTTTLAEMNAGLEQRAAQAGVPIVCRQSNYEGQLIDWIQAEGPDARGVIINPGALTHYSLSLRDALAMLRVPIIEVHLSNVYKRETFRHHSVVAPVVQGQIAGLGPHGYLLALEWLLSNSADA